VGGELFILPKMDSECGAPTGATTDLFQGQVKLWCVQ
jgi:hypothetical protein